MAAYSYCLLLTKDLNISPPFCLLERHLLTPRIPCHAGPTCTLVSSRFSLCLVRGAVVSLAAQRKQKFG